MNNIPKFTATEWSSAKEKTKFATQFMRFVEHDFKETMFPQWFYQRLSMCFGMIAHYDRDGFYSTFFEDTKGKTRFLRACLKDPSSGDPSFTYSDTQRFLQEWLRKGNFLARYEWRLCYEIEQNQRDQLTQLQIKYEPTYNTQEVEQ